VEYLLTKAVADRANVCEGTVRDYCRRGLLDPIRDSSGRRLFTEDDVLKVREIYVENTSRRRSLMGARSGPNN
jgi:DNA-binding transcriptional MerR regulator